MDEVIRIGGAIGYWGDADRGTPQFLRAGGLDFIVYDYLAEITMSIMARARAKDASLGYALDFVTQAMAPNLANIERQQVRIVANAGGVNPTACAAALRQLIEAGGHNLKVACVTGDDLLSAAGPLSERGITEMFSGEAMPPAQQIQSVNAYLGAFPIAKALDLGADIVVTGRCVDSAVTLGACIHSFGWQADDWDRLAMGSVAGHLLECGPQATGGNFTDWQEVADEIETLGCPIAEVAANGEFVCTKPAGTGGLVNVGTVAEQLLYEIGDPQAYLLPDVSCDFSQVQLTQESAHRVRVSGGRGRPPTTDYKVSATYADGFRGGALMTYYGIDAQAKAQAQAQAIFRAASAALKARELADFSDTSVELLGAESQYGAHARVHESREVVLKVAAKHPDARGIGILLKETGGLGLATPPGLSGFQAGRPRPSPVVRLFSFLLSKTELDIRIEVDGEVTSYGQSSLEAAPAEPIRRPTAPPPPRLDDAVEVPLVALAWGRSGDKGNKANIGVIARQSSYLPYLYHALTVAVVRDRFAHFLVPGSLVERFLLPGSHALNFVLHEVLGGGGIASLRSDPQGKGYAQLLLDVGIPVSRQIAAEVGAGSVAP